LLRGDKPHASTRLINFFEGAAQFSWTGATVTPGIILTGDKLVDNFDYREQLINFEKEAIGGEMEAAGVYVSSQDYKVDWIVIKAICDWGDNKGVNKERRQKKAAKSAAEFLIHALKQVPLKSVLERFPRDLPDNGGSRRSPQTPRPRSAAVSGQALKMVPFRESGMNAVHLEREKHTRNGLFWVHTTFHLLVAANPIKLMGIAGTYYTSFGCACFLAERRFSINGGPPLEIRPDGETLYQSLSLKANSEHQLACSWRLRPPLMEQTPAVCDAGDLELKLTIRRPPELDLRSLQMFYRFTESAATIGPSDGIRLPEGLRDKDLERAANELNLPQGIYERLKELSPCTRHLVATTDSELILQNLLLRSEHRTWLKNIRSHCLGRD
jgi:hypothetical protein